MATEDEMWEEMLKTEVSVDSVLKRIDREEKELQLLKNEKDNAETNKKILAIEESIDEDKKWISMQKKSQPEVVIPPPPKIDDIVANDPEIIRICSEISTFLSNTAKDYYITEFAHARNRGSAEFNLPMIAINEYRYKPTDTIFYPNTFIEPVKWYVREIIKPKGYAIVPNLKTAIEAMEKSLNDLMDSPNPEYRSVSVYGVIFFQEIYEHVLLKSGNGIFVDRNIAIQYVSLVLQLHRRIQEIMVENGFQQGGKRKRTIKKGRKTRKTKMYKKIRTNRKK
jgi:hypothetical protein